MSASQVTLQQVKEFASSFLKLKDDRVIDVVMATFVANKFDADPLWMMITAPPSSAKTEVLTALSGHPDAHILSSLTPQTLISGKIRKDGSDPSLLPLLSDKILVLKDFTTILTMYHEAKAEIFGQLREVYDGKYGKAFGTGERKDWEGKVGLIAGVTPVIDKQSAVNQQLGERFLYYRIPADDYRKTGVTAARNIFGQGAGRKKFKQLVGEFLTRFDNGMTHEFTLSEEYEHKLVYLGGFISLARATVDRERHSKLVTYIPQPEGPARLIKQLGLLGAGIAAVQEKSELDEYSYGIMKKTARDSMPAMRLKILRTLWEFEQERVTCWTSTKDVARGCGIPTSTTKVCLEDLMMVGLLQQERETLAETAPYVWAVTEEMVELITKSEIFSDEKGA